MTYPPKPKSFNKMDFLNRLDYIDITLCNIKEQIGMVEAWINDYIELINAGVKPIRYDINSMIRVIKRLPLTRSVKKDLINVLREMRDMI